MNIDSNRSPRLELLRPQWRDLIPRLDADKAVSGMGLFGQCVHGAVRQQLGRIRRRAPRVGLKVERKLGIGCHPQRVQKSETSGCIALRRVGLERQCRRKWRIDLDVRLGLAAGKPVAVTPLSIFDDVAEAVHRLPGADPQAIAKGIAKGIRALLDDPVALK